MVCVATSPAAIACHELIGASADRRLIFQTKCYAADKVGAMGRCHGPYQPNHMWMHGTNNPRAVCMKQLGSRLVQTASRKFRCIAAVEPALRQVDVKRATRTSD